MRSSKTNATITLHLFASVRCYLPFNWKREFSATGIRFANATIARHALRVRSAAAGFGAQIEARVRGISTGAVNNLCPDFIERRAFYQKSGGALLEGARGLRRIKNRGEHKHAS